MFEKNYDRIAHTRYFFPKVKIKDYNVKIDGQIFFDQQINNDLITYDQIQKIATDQRDDCLTVCLLDYPIFKEHYKMKAIDLSKEQALNAVPKAIQQINFTGNLVGDGNSRCFSLLEKRKEPF